MKTGMDLSLFKTPLKSPLLLLAAVFLFLPKISEEFIYGHLPHFVLVQYMQLIKAFRDW